MCEAPVKASGRMVRLALNSSSVAAVVAFSGISNHEENYLVREMLDDKKEKTLTLRRDKSIAKDQKKLDEMRKKLHTEDDELEWLDHSRTLREQGVLDVDTTAEKDFLFLRPKCGPA
uniref:Talin-1 n=1 Tax=Magallana gigas TaxID=29159 RepID=A0A8W8NSW4_MAGGI